MQKNTVGRDPGQFAPDLARCNPAPDFQRVNVHRALAAIAQFDVDMGHQVVADIPHHP